LAQRSGTEQVTKPVTTSIDAIMALIDRKLPGWIISTWIDTSNIVQARAEMAPSYWKARHDEDAEDVGGVVTTAATLPLALCKGLILALEKQEK